MREAIDSAWADHREAFNAYEAEPGLPPVDDPRSLRETYATHDSPAATNYIRATLRLAALAHRYGWDEVYGK